jgi:broad specificity phosphatase PhoE
MWFVLSAYRYRVAVLTILLTRHGHTDLSEPDRYLGRRIDASLSDRGRHAAQALGDRLKSVPMDRVISSPLERAQETARLIVGDRGLNVETDERMIEFDYGGWEGMTTDEVADKLHDQYELYDANPAIYRPGGGENGNQAAERAMALIEYLLDWWGGEGDRTVLLVGHSSINRVLLAAITNVPMADYRRRFLQDWANLTVLRWHDRDGGPLLALVNDMAHNRGVSGDTWS